MMYQRRASLDCLLGWVFCDNEEEDELILHDGRDDLTDYFCDDNGWIW